MDVLSCGPQADFAKLCAEGNLAAVDARLRNGREKGWPKDMGRGLQDAIRFRRFDVVECMVADLPPSLLGPMLDTPMLTLAIQYAPFDLLDRLLELSPVPSARSVALFHAFSLPRLELIERLNSRANRVKALAIGLKEGKVPAAVDALVSTLRPEEMAQALEAVVSRVERGGIDRFDLFMKLATRLRQPRSGVPSDVPDRGGLRRTIITDRADDAAWNHRWVRWMMTADGLSDGTPWYELHAEPMPEHVRAGYWMILGGFLRGKGFDIVPERDRERLVRAVFADKQQFQKSSEWGDIWPNGSVLSRLGLRDPLNEFLIAWGAAGLSDLFVRALESDDEGMAQRLAGFGADLNARLSTGETALQRIVAYGWASLPTGNARTNWSVLTSKGETLAHIPINRLPGSDLVETEAASDALWRQAQSVLSRIVPYLPREVWSVRDDCGRTPLQAWREAEARLPPSANAAAWKNSSRGATICSLLVAGDLAATLDSVPLPSRLPTRRPRL